MLLTQGYQRCELLSARCQKCIAAQYLSKASRRGAFDSVQGADLSAEAMSHDDAESSGESSNGSLRRNSVDGHAIATGPSEKVHSDKLDQEHWLATLGKICCASYK